MSNDTAKTSAIATPDPLPAAIDRAPPAAAPPLPPLPPAVRVTEADDPLDDRSWADVVRALVEKAKAGHEFPAEILRRVRRYSPRLLRLDLPPITDAAGVAQAQAYLIAETFGGRLDTREGAALSRMVENRRRSIEMLDFEKDLRALNEANAEDARKRRGGR